MKPADRVIDGLPHVRFGEGQPEYNVLPAVRLDNPQREIVSRWELDEADRARLAAGGSVYLHIYTFGAPLQPVHLSTEPPELFVLSPDGVRVV